MRRRRIAFALVALTLAGLTAFAILVTPENPLTRAFQQPRSGDGGTLIVGPYPDEAELARLRDAHVSTIVTLLDPRLPYEAVLLERERAAARRYGLTLVEVPMASFLGVSLDPDDAARADAAADAVMTARGIVYLHCYLGVHRVSAVLAALDRRGALAGRLAPGASDAAERARRMAKAGADYAAGRYADALATLRADAQPPLPERLLMGWALYRSGDLEAAGATFDAILGEAPELTDALVGRGYVALRRDDLAGAELAFGAALARSEHADATAGLGFIRYRQGRLAEAARYLEAAGAAAPDNDEVSATLGLILAQLSK